MSHREKQLKKSAVRVVESDLGVIDLPYLLLTLLLVAIGLYLIVKDGEVFHQLYRGSLGRDEMYQKISDTLTILATGGERDE